MKAPVDVTYLADTVVLLRYLEALGSVRRAISVIKKRMGVHDRPSASTASITAAYHRPSPLDGFQESCAAFPSISARPPLLQDDVVEAGPIVRARRHSRSDGTGRLGGRGA